MLRAGWWGLFGASSLVFGALIAFAFDIGRRPLGLIMGFGSGVLISAVAYELVQEAGETADTGVVVGIGFGAGALAFFAGNLLIDRPGRGGHPVADGDGSESGMPIVLGAVLDGIPESVTLGISLIGGGGVSVSLIVAVFISNLPESIAASTDLAHSGTARLRILGLWAVVVAASAVAAALGYGLLGSASNDVIAATQAFAGGAILTMLADSMMPQAFEDAGPAVGLATAVGFGLAFALASM